MPPAASPDGRLLWRISNHADLTGAGGMFAPARWHTAGRPVVYLAESPAGALLEALVHLELSETHRPSTYQMLTVEAAKDVAFDQIDPLSLPPDWPANEAETQTRGDLWLRGKGSALLRVPCAIVPETWNWLLNPRHADAQRVRIKTVRQNPFDQRLL